MMTGHRIWVSVTDKRNAFPPSPPPPLLLLLLLLRRRRHRRLLLLLLLLLLLFLLHVTFFFPSQMVKIMEEYLDDYNQINTAQMKLVLFGDAVRHVARISRVIRQPLGNALLLGVGGSGRQSLTRLAAHM